MKSRKVSPLMWIVVVVTLLLGLALVGCNGEEEEVGEEVGEEVVGEEETFTLSVNHTMPSESNAGQRLQELAERIEERSDGRIEFEFYWNSSLVDIPDTVPGVADGRADISNVIFHHHAQYFPITGELLGVPFAGYPSREAATEIYHDLAENIPEINEQYEEAGVKAIYVGSMPAYNLFTTTTEEIRAPEDIEGMDIIAERRQNAQVIDEAGATPNEIQVGDWYMSFDRGVCEGAITHFSVTTAIGVLELMEQHVIFGEQGFNIDFEGLIMNPDSYEQLPDELQEIFDEEMEWFHDYNQQGSLDETEIFMDNAREMGNEFTELTEEEIKEWEELAAPIKEQTFEELEEQGVPAHEIYEEIQELAPEYE